jgi:hypothetical protein
VLYPLTRPNWRAREEIEMHDLDRTMFEIGEIASEYEGSYESESAYEGLLGGELHDGRELELASGLLEVSSEQELEQFLGDLVRSAAGAAGRFAGSPAGRQLIGVLRGAAKKSLPIVGRAAGEWVRPGGGAAGARLAQSAGNLFGLELEGLSNEDRELETAKAFVRFATDASRAAATAPPAPPAQVVRAAVTSAARRHAPGLLEPAGGRRGRHGSGRWVRRGNTIVVYGN